MIINFEDDDDDDDEQGHMMSAAITLQKLSILLGNDVMDPVINYVAANIQQINWKQKYSALIALGSITDGPEKQKFMETISSALLNLIAMTTDPRKKIREGISWVFSRICEFHPHVVSNPETAAKFIPTLMESLKDTPKVSNMTCSALEKLAYQLQPLNEEPNNIITPYF